MPSKDRRLQLIAQLGAEEVRRREREQRAKNRQQQRARATMMANNRENAIQSGNGNIPTNMNNPASIPATNMIPGNMNTVIGTAPNPILLLPSLTDNNNPNNFGYLVETANNVSNAMYPHQLFLNNLAANGSLSDMMNNPFRFIRLPPFLNENLFMNIRESCTNVCKQALHVRINTEEIFNLVDGRNGNDIFSINCGSSNGHMDHHLQIQALIEKNAWDANNWHFCADASTCGPLTAQYILVLDALNFCFWPSADQIEYDHFARCLKQVLEQDITAFNAEKLMHMTEEVLSSWLQNMDIPLLSERVARLREIGFVLAHEFDGMAANMIKYCDQSAAKLTDLVIKSFPGFRDTAIYKGQLIHLYKRAQIFVADLWGAYGRPTDKQHPFYFKDIDQVTMFADYRIPQVLRHVGVLQYSSALSALVDAGTLLTAGCEEEIEIRAATIIAVDMIQKSLNDKYNLNLTSIEVDWLLWNWGEVVRNSIGPHHRVLTIYY